MLPYISVDTKDSRFGDDVHVAYLSTYPPRECGIATFCQDVLTATLLGDNTGPPLVVAMEAGSAARQYAWPVTMVVDDRDEDEYEAAADFLNNSPADLVSIQHEFGIFGGVQGQGLFRFLDMLRKPVVTTLHTVLARPDDAMRRYMQRLGAHSECLVVMNALAGDILDRDYGIERRRIEMIHHGALPPSLESKEDAKARLGLSGRKVISTFGLISPGKGLQYAISALPGVIERHPDVCYLIIGQTHPGVRWAEQETYREQLVRQVEELGLEQWVKFVNRYVSKAEIVRYLAASDVYVTPYLNPQQITSGTLAYALAAGNAIVSTRYLYAEFLLANNRGLLVDFESAEGIERALNAVLDSPELRESLARRCLNYGQQMHWPTVGAAYLRLFGDVVGRQVRPIQQRQHVPARTATLMAPLSLPGGRLPSLAPEQVRRVV